MRTRYFLLVAAAITILSGCIPSVNPFYRDEDVCFDSKLLGQWQEKGKGGLESWRFERGDGQG